MCSSNILSFMYCYTKKKNGQMKIKSKEKIFEHTVSSKIAFIKLYSILYIPYTQSKK